MLPPARQVCMTNRIEQETSGTSSVGSRAVQTAEILLMLATVPLIDFSGFLSFRLADLQPSPLWVPVVLAGALYGRGPGLLTALFASAISIGMVWTEVGNYVDVYAFIIDNAVSPILWLLAALVLGNIRERHRDALIRAEADSAQRTIEAQTLAQRVQLLGREVGVLEHRIASSGASAAGATLQTLERLLDLPLEHTLEAFSQALNRLIGAQGIDIYLPDKHRWVSGATLADVNGALLYADDLTASVCRKVVTSGRVLSCFREADAKTLQGRAAMATAFEALGGRFKVVVLLREVDPACLTPAGEAALSLTSFILGSRAVQERLPALEKSRSARARVIAALRPRLRIVNGEQADG